MPAAIEAQPFAWAAHPGAAPAWARIPGIDPGTSALRDDPRAVRHRIRQRLLAGARQTTRRSARLPLATNSDTLAFAAIATRQSKPSRLARAPCRARYGE